MKKLILFFVLLSGCVTAVLAAESKIAIIGDSPIAEKTADLALTELSGKKDIAVLERSEIDRLLREHKLTRLGMTAAELSSFAKIAHVDIFAVINSAIKNKRKVVSSLLVFDAKTGFKLCDISLSDILDEDVKTINNAVITASTQLQQIEKISYLAILAVRNAGVPSKYKYELQNIATEVRRRLVAAPDIAVLERSRLGLVVKERELSKKIYKLYTSAYLLDFEYSQGSSANIVNLKLYIMSPGGKILKKYAYADCLKKPSEVVRKIISDLSRYFNKPFPGNAKSAKAEAKRYFNEYKYLFNQKQYIAAVKALKAAIALDVNNVKYQVTLLSAIPFAARGRRSPSKQKYFSDLLRAARQILKESKAVRQRFPNYPKGITEIQTINNWLWSNWHNNYSVLTTKQKQAVIDYSHKMRPFFSQELTRYWKYDLSDGIDSSRELQNYEAHLMRNVWWFLYFDNDEFIQANIINSTKVIKAYNEFAQKHRFVKLHLGFCAGHSSRNFYNALTRNLQKDEVLDFIAAAKASPQADIRENGYVMEFLRKSALKKHDRKYFVAELKKLLPVLVEIYQDKNKPLSKIPNSFMYTVRDYLRHRDAPRGLYDLLEKTQKEFIINNSKPQSWATFNVRNKQAKTAEDKAKLVIASKEYIGTWRRANSKTNRIDFGDHPAHVIGKIARAINPFTNPRVKDRKLCLKALPILNAPLKVKLVKTVFESRNNFFRNAVEHKGNVYLIAGGRTLMIFKFNLKSGEIKKVFSMILNVEYSLNSFFVNDKYFALGAYKKILIISRKNEGITIIEDLANKFVHAVAVMNDRVYAFTGLKKRIANTLFSCDLNGEKRKVHISTRGRVKRNLLEKQSDMRVSGLFPDPGKNRILFTNAWKYPGLWAMNVEDGKLKCLLTINNTHEPWAKRIKDKLYISGSSLNTAFFIYDVKKDSYEFICFNDSKNYLKGFGLQAHKPRYIIGQRLNMHPPFFAKDNYLWAGGYGAVFTDMNARNGMYCIYSLGEGIGQCSNQLFFPCPDSRDVYVVCSRSIFRISPPRRKFKEKKGK
jgi:hypothetical protein